MGDLTLEDLQLGLPTHAGVCNVVASVLSRIPGATVASTITGGKTFFTDIDIPRDALKVTIFKGEQEFRNGKIWVRATDDTSILVHRAWDFQHPKMLETCSGLGAVDRGYKHCGIEETMYNDVNTEFCRWLSQKGKSVVQGDICDSRVVQQIAEFRPLVISAGIACQPYSELGDKKENADSRSKSLLGVLHAAHNLQCPIVIMECTPRIAQSKWAQEVLKKFTQQTGFQMQQLIQELHHIWPSKRTRWWCILSHPQLQVGPLHTPPKLRFQPSMMHLFCRCLNPNEQQLKELECDLYELRMFHTMSGGLKKHLVDFTKPLPTATHSWGSQLSACMCGCRQTGFKHERLEQRGLYAQLIPLSGTHRSGHDKFTALRHMHPSEVALSLGLPADHVGTKNNLKLELAGVGQMASPLQGLWVLAQIFNKTQKIHPMKCFVDPIASMKNLVEEVFRSRDELLPPAGSNMYMKLFEQAWSDYGEDEACQLPTKPFEIEDEGEFENHDLKPLAKEEPKIGEDFFQSKSEHGSVGITSEIHNTRYPNENRRNDHQEVERFTPPTNEDVPFNTTDAFRAGIVPGFGVKRVASRDQEQMQKKQKTSGEEHTVSPRKHSFHPKQDPIVAIAEAEPTDRKDPDPEITEDDKGQDRVAIIQDGAIEKTGERHSNQVGPVGTIEIMEIHVVQAGSAIQQVKLPVGSRIAQLANAELTMWDKRSKITITNAMGEACDTAEVISHGQILFVHEEATNNMQTIEHKSPPKLVDDKRDVLLWQQFGWTAWDEMEFYRKEVEHEFPHQTFRNCMIQDDLTCAATTCHHILSVAEAMVEHEQKRNATCVLYRNHWQPIGVHYEPEGMMIVTTKEFATQLKQWCQQVWGTEMADVKWAYQEIPQAFQNDCGFQTIAWIRNFLAFGEHILEVTGHEACMWRANYHRHLDQQGEAETFVRNALVLGGAKQTQESLQDLIRDHGVHPNRTQECAKQLTEAIGATAIQQIIQSARPWADLKARASMVRPPIRIVLAQELQDVIDKRVKEGKEVGRKSNKTQSKPKRDKDNFQLQADQIYIPNAVFCQADGKELSQIPVGSIGANSSGIAVVNIDAALPFFSLQAPVSAEGVALLILDFTDGRIPSAHARIKVPAICKETEEPMILQAAILQIGSKQVARNVPTQCLQVQEIDNRVIRIVVYKDQYTGDWTEFVAQPVRQIMQRQPFADLQQSILDVWDRQFLSIKMTKQQASDAAVFIVNFRVDSKAAEDMLQVSGTDGFYCEPRSATGRQPDDAFQVVWLPKKSFAEAQLARNTMQHSNTLARSGDRYGLRVQNEVAAEVHRIHRPEVLFIKGMELKKYRVGPMPYGSTRQSIANVFRKWEWEARPIGPQSQSNDRTGMIWVAQAATPPSSWVFQLAHGDVLVSPEQGSATVVAEVPTTIVASEKTMQSLRQNKPKEEPKRETDPWLHHDPWQQQGKTKELSVSQFAAMQSKLEAVVEEKIKHASQDDPMTSRPDERVSALEHQVQQLASSVQAFQQQQAGQNTQFQAQLAAVDKKVDQHQQSIHQLLDNKLEDQMARIEQLFTKRARME